MRKSLSQGVLDRWKRDPVAFITEALVDPETGRPFVLYPAESRFIREAFTPTPAGKLPYAEILFSAPKKSGKTALAALCTVYTIVCLGGPYAEGYCVANDFEQAASRVFQAIARILRASSYFRESVNITTSRITFLSTGATITALASDYAGAAGANPTIIVFDELWAYMSERSHRLFDEMVPVPTRKISVRLTVTYAGFSGESELLEGLYKRGLAGETVAPDLYRAGPLLMYWTHDLIAPWQADIWREQMREMLRHNQYLRLIENRWVTTESSFIPLQWWDECIVEPRPLVFQPDLPVWIGVDASVKRDSTAMVACSFDPSAQRVRTVCHRIFQPSPDDPLDFEATVERTLIDWSHAYTIREIKFDPYQMVSSAKRLRQLGLPMTEFPQTTANLTEASSNLYELLKGRNLALYPDAEMRLAVSRAVALETARGWRIAKEKQSHKIDVVVALAQAALGAVQETGVATVTIYPDWLLTGGRSSVAQAFDGVPPGDPLTWGDPCSADVDFPSRN